MQIFRYKTPSEFDDMLIVADEEGLRYLYFDNESKDARSLKEVSMRKIDDNIIKISETSAETQKIIEQTVLWLDQYFSGKIPDFLPKIKIDSQQGLSSFRKEVLDIMSKIPYGKLITYKNIADEIAKNRSIKKMSAQAVGGAVGWNPICIIIPCHRVIGTDGSLTGYGGGLNNKKALLSLEKNTAGKL